jgi:hypothetical protein
LTLTGGGGIILSAVLMSDFFVLTIGRTEYGS